METNTNTDVDKLITYGQMALEQGWYDKAREYFQQALAFDASNREAMKGLAQIDEILREAAAVEPLEAEIQAEPSLAACRRGNRVCPSIGQV
jgi:Tfp pilus assembly protein PilF